VQPSLATTTGPDEAIKIVQSWGQAFSVFELEVKHVASTDDTVMVERVDVFKRDDGSTFLALPVVGVAEFANGKITEWREYYDSAAVPGLNG
jgi:limonene-1,2-epoxide hydrolase